MTQQEQIQKVKEFQEKIKQIRENTSKTFFSENQEIELVINGDNQIMSLKILKNMSNEDVASIIMQTTNNAFAEMGRDMKQSINLLTQSILPVGFNL